MPLSVLLTSLSATWTKNNGYCFKLLGIRGKLQGVRDYQCREDLDIRKKENKRENLHLVSADILSESSVGGAEA